MGQPDDKADYVCVGPNDPADVENTRAALSVEAAEANMVADIVALASRTEGLRVLAMNLLYIVLAILPTAYVWSLPQLANLCDDSFMRIRPWYVKAGYRNTCLAYKCEGYPYCKDSPFGASISSFISTPPATGAFCAVFAWPFAYLWYTYRDVDRHRLSLLSMVAFQASMGLFVFFNTYYFPSLHWQFENLMVISCVAHYYMLARVASQRGQIWCYGFLFAIIACMSFFFVLFNLPTFGIEPKSFSPWICYATEACGLSAVSLFPWVWESEKLDRGGGQRFVEDSNTSAAYNLVSTGAPYQVARSVSLRDVPWLTRNAPNMVWVLALLPTVYVWSLPVLAEYCHSDFMRLRAEGVPAQHESACLVFRCDGYPFCHDSVFGTTVSAYISTPPATALFAFVFAWPLSHLWYIQKDTSGRCFSLLSMIGFQMSMGGFLVCNCYYFAAEHGQFQNLTVVFAFIHYAILLRAAAKASKWRCTVFLWVLVLALLVFAASFSMPSTIGVEPKSISPWFFYAVEAFGLSAVSLFPWLWESERKVSVPKATMPKESGDSSEKAVEGQ